MEDNESLVFRNTCNECGLPMKFHSFEKILIISNQYVVVKLFCQNLEHKTITRISFEEYQSIIDESLENICKCTFCNKLILEESIIPYYCYNCKKIVCSDCLNNNKHDKEHKNVFKFNELNKKCLIHYEEKNDTDYFCLFCKNNYCKYCLESHIKEHNIKKKNEYLIDALIQENITKIKKEQYGKIMKKERLLIELKKMNILINFDDFLLKEKNKNIHLLNDYEKNSKIIDIKNIDEKITDIEEYINTENNKEALKLNEKMKNKEKNEQIEVNIKEKKIENNKEENIDNKQNEIKEDKQEKKIEKNEEKINEINNVDNNVDNKVDNNVDNNVDNKEDNKEDNKVDNKVDNDDNNQNKINNLENNKLDKEENNNQNNIKETKEINIDNQVNNKDENKDENKEENIVKENYIEEKQANNRDDIKEENKEDKKDKKIKIHKKKKKGNNINEINAINVIYYDSNVNNPGMDIINDCCNLATDTNGSIILVNDLRNLELLLKNIQKNYQNSKFFLIVNGKSANEVVKFIKKNNYKSLFINACIYTSDIKNYSSKETDLIGKIEDDIEKIIEFINEEFKKNNINNGKIYINSLINYIFYKNDYFPLHEELSKFYGNENAEVYNSHFVMLTDFITNENLNLSKDERDNLINCFETFSELQNKNYENIITCYLKEYNYSKFLNSLLMKKDLSIFTKIGYFAGNLMHSIVEYGKKQDKGINDGFTFYKGMELNIIEVLEYLKNRQYNITFPYFFTMSDKKSFAEITSKRNKSFKERESKELYSVIMEIKYLFDDGYEPCIYNLTDLCQYPDEEEYFLLPFTFLKLEKITIDSKNLIADIELEVIGKEVILENDIKELKSIEYDEKKNIMISK